MATSSSGAKPVVIESGSVSLSGSVALDATTLAALETITVASITTSVTPGTAAANLGKAEDAGHITGDVGVMALGVRNDTAVARSGTDGDYEPIPVPVISSIVGAAVHVVGDGDKYCRGTQATDTAPVGGPVQGGGIMVQGGDPSAIVTYATDGNVVPFTLDEYGQMMVRFSTQSGTATVNTEFTAAATAADAQSNPSTSVARAFCSVYNGTTWDRMRSVINGQNTTGTGILAAGVLAQLDDTSPTAITENQFGLVRMSALRGLHNQPSYSYRSDTYTATGNGTTVDLTSNPMKSFSIQVVQTGTVTAWDVRLEGSIDGTNFSQILAHTNADGSGTVKASADFLVRYFRSRCNSITLGAGTNVIAHIVGGA